MQLNILNDKLLIEELIELISVRANTTFETEFHEK